MSFPAIVSVLSSTRGWVLCCWVSLSGGEEIKIFRPGAENQTLGGFGPTVRGISIRVAGVYFVLVGCTIGREVGHVLITSTLGKIFGIFFLAIN